MWVRGLKHRRCPDSNPGLHVAPYVGAWIETPSLTTSALMQPVAPYVGAWIET